MPIGPRALGRAGAAARRLLQCEHTEAVSRELRVNMSRRCFDGDSASRHWARRGAHSRWHPVFGVGDGSNLAGAAQSWPPRAANGDSFRGLR